MITAHSPKYTSNGDIELIVSFPWLDNEVPFTAVPSDTEYSTDLFNRAQAGEFGIIEPYVALDIPAGQKPVSPRQIRQALTASGMREAVEAAVAAADRDTKDWWEFSTSYERTNPVVIAMGTVLGVTPSQMDDLWVLASTL